MGATYHHPDLTCLNILPYLVKFCLRKKENVDVVKNLPHPLFVYPLSPFSPKANHYPEAGIYSSAHVSFNF